MKIAVTEVDEREAARESGEYGAVARKMTDSLAEMLDDAGVRIEAAE